ncbi:hypothetical protein L226DRAFT_573630 [Lentinus tigrinus ALCF2SS1-7]|uniref:uncharacterized protein n=1 Tax=Lentinus tigrinus ALCF2SS1-7 TaxID=1328758 RepID=UPI001165CA06|nr:hypothetical protein L226DRAFT_573630 [Lentinus tigrinus ALCF2SS1-7]
MSVVVTPAALPTATLAGKVMNLLFKPDWGCIWRSPAVRMGGWKHVLGMDLAIQTNVATGAISDDGKWIAVADWYEMKLFQLMEEKNGDLKPRRIPSPQLCRASSRAPLQEHPPSPLRLTPLNSSSPHRAPRVLRKFEQHRLRDGYVRGRVVAGCKTSASAKGDKDVEMAPNNASDDAQAAHDDAGSSSAESDVEDSKLIHTTVTRMAVSPDGQWLATSDTRRRTHVFKLDAVQHHCTLPTFPQ